MDLILDGALTNYKEEHYIENKGESHSQRFQQLIKMAHEKTVHKVVILVDVFSDFNNLDDNSMENAYSDICGWTEEELTDSFQSGIQALAAERDEDFDTTLSALSDYYDGYLFSEDGKKLYNPSCVMKALYGRLIEAYWFELVTPKFLVKKLKTYGFI